MVGYSSIVISLAEFTTELPDGAAYFDAGTLVSGAGVLVIESHPNDLGINSLL